MTLLFLVVSFLSFGQQQGNYSDWKIQSKSEIRLLPKYGNVIKSEAQKKADQELIETYLTQQGTHRKASDMLVSLGFKYLYQGDLKTAMFRFNQAWLLDPTNENSFWGFGAIYATFGDNTLALKQYDEGLVLNPKSTNILTDKATIFLAKYADSNKDKDFNDGVKLLQQSYSINPKYANTLFKLSTAYYVKKNCVNALRYYRECKNVDSRLITKEYSDAITALCKS
ncbi:hypothetical protein DHW03_17235 [Pedobacter yonginense]|uniref:Uncharacterized protein n=2 Tax=Pedobacter yonginense TaxID=651869 RepID=A0A317EI82_9SPHI|nr:hypothetical protein DHW03_17235 [Pedobacter yonginense]